MPEEEPSSHPEAKNSEPPTAEVGEAARPVPPGRGPRPLRWLWMLVPLALVAAIGWYFWQLAEKEAEAGRTAGATTSDDRGELVLGRDYHVYVRVIDFYEKDHEGDDWDGGGDGVPDPYYRIFRGDAEIFESETRDDVFTTVMSPLGVDVHDAILGGRITLASALQAATIAYSDEDSDFRVKVYDEDTFSRDDVVLDRTFRMADLHLGENVVTFEQSEETGVKRIVVRVVDAMAPVPEQLQLLEGDGA